AASAELLGHLDAQDAEFAQPTEELAGRAAHLVPFLAIRRDLTFDEVAHHLPELLVFFGEDRPLHGLSSGVWGKAREGQLPVKLPVRRSRNAERASRWSSLWCESAWRDADSSRSVSRSPRWPSRSSFFVIRSAFGGLTATRAASAFAASRSCSGSTTCETM